MLTCRRGFRGLQFNSLMPYGLKHAFYGSSCCLRIAIVLCLLGLELAYII